MVDARAGKCLNEAKDSGTSVGFWKPASLREGDRGRMC